MKKRGQGNLFLTLDALRTPGSSLSQTGCVIAIRALLIQFMEDLSDREMERYLQENLANKWFCDMNLGEEAPDHSYSGDFRKRLGTE